MSTQHNGSNPDPAAHEKIRFPVDFDLKVILDATISDEEHKANITRVLADLYIPHFKWKLKFSEKARFISITIRIHLVSYEQMQSLYTRLREIPGVKYAI